MRAGGRMLGALLALTSIAAATAQGLPVEPSAPVPGVAAPLDGAPTPTDTTTEPDTIEEIVVTAVRLGLIGTATTSSQGVVANDELALTPAFRPGQLLETIPGLVVTSHSGEGKANQYLLRGFNLDHGTDLATTVDGMPVNEVTQAHGQGYTDLNFMIPELATNIRFTKGPYFAAEGDFASVGSVHIGYVDSIADQANLTVGTLGYQRLFTAASGNLGAGTLLGALELQHYDGPWVNADDQRKINTVLRYTDGDQHQGYSLTGMFYHGLWNSTTDQPARAMDAGLIPRFGSLDPTDGGQAQRASLSALFHHSMGGAQLNASVYGISNHLTLWNDFTHNLIDPLNGDQEAQQDDRRTLGGDVTYSNSPSPFGLNTDLAVGLSARYDVIDVSRRPTRDRTLLAPAADPLGFAEADHVRESNVGAYAQATTFWTHWMRSTLGLREDVFHESDTGTNRGSASQALLQPKGSLIFTPVDTTELYVSAGRGFHSDDARGVNQAQLTGRTGAPLIARSTGEEIGLREQFQHNLVVTLTLFRLDFASETTYDPDIGQDSAGPASRRVGGELNVTYQMRRWLEFYTSIATTRARYNAPSGDGTGHVGQYIPNAPNVIASFAAYVKNLGPWSGALQYRYLGREPLTSDNAVTGDGYGEWNGDVRYALDHGWTVGIGLYNILDVQSSAAEYWYIDRLPGEPAAGVAGLHIHPLEPRTVRVTLGKEF